MLAEKYKTIEAGPEFIGKNVHAQKELVSNGKSSFFVDVVRFPDSVAILPIREDGKIILERHYRHPIKETILEVPAGKLEPNEKPEDGARRELLEETGFEAKNFREVGLIFAAPGYSTERIHLFTANVKNIPERSQTLEVTERITLQEFGMNEVPALIAGGDLKDSMTLSLIIVAQIKGFLKIK